MIPLLLFLLACAAVYVGTVQAAFSLLMRLPLRLNAERHRQPGMLGQYLDEPVRLFLPAGLLQAVALLLAFLLASRLAGDEAVARWLALAVLVLLVPLCTWVIPLLVARRQPERVLGVLLPSFHAAASVLRPLTGAVIERTERRGRRAGRRAGGQRRGDGRRRQRRAALRGGRAGRARVAPLG